MEYHIRGSIFGEILGKVSNTVWRIFSAKELIEHETPLFMENFIQNFHFVFRNPSLNKTKKYMCVSGNGGHPSPLFAGNISVTKLMVDLGVLSLPLYRKHLQNSIGHIPSH